MMQEKTKLEHLNSKKFWVVCLLLVLAFPTIYVVFAIVSDTLSEDMVYVLYTSLILPLVLVAYYVRLVIATREINEKIKAASLGGWHEIPSQVKSFRHKDEPEIIHVLKNRANEYYVLYEDGYDSRTGTVEFFTLKQFENRFKIQV